MRETIQDKMVAFVAERGDDGATSAELAHAFLAPASAPETLCEKLISNVLEEEPRLTRADDGRWVPARAPGGKMLTGEFTVVEAVEIGTGRARLPVEWAAVRVDAQGNVTAGEEGVIRPDQRPHGAVLPDHLKGKLNEARSFQESAAAAADLARGGTLVCVRPGPFQEGVLKSLSASGEPAEPLYLGRLAKQTLGRDIRTIEDLATRLGVPVREPRTAAERTAFVAELLGAMLSMRGELNLGEPDGWAERQKPARMEADFSRYDFDRAFLDNLPETPGVYLMRDGNGEIVYVGKAVNLRRRVNDYFRARMRRDEKTTRVQEETASVEVEETGSELAALLMEHQLIAAHQPRINIQSDVHDRHASQRAPSRRWAVVLPAVAPEEAEVFLFYGNRTLRRVRIRRDEPEQLRPALAEFFFGERPPEPEAESEQPWLRIAWSWLEQHRDEANVVDVEMTGGLDDTLRVLAATIAEGPGGGKVIHV